MGGGRTLALALACVLIQGLACAESPAKSASPPEASPPAVSPPAASPPAASPPAASPPAASPQAASPPDVAAAAAEVAGEAVVRTVRRTSSSIERLLQLFSRSGDGRGGTLPLIVLPLPLDGRDELGYDKDSGEYEERLPPRRRVLIPAERRRPVDDYDAPPRRLRPRIERIDDRRDDRERLFLIPRAEFERQRARPDDRREQTFLVRKDSPDHPRNRPLEQPPRRPLERDDDERLFLVPNPNYRGRPQEDSRRPSPSTRPQSPYELDSDPRDRPGPPRRVPVRPLDRVSSRPQSPFDIDTNTIRDRPSAPPRGRPLDREQPQGLEPPFDSQRDRPRDRPLDRPRGRPAVDRRPVDTQPQSPFELPILVPDGPPSRRPVDRPIERPIDHPVDRPRGRPQLRPERPLESDRLESERPRERVRPQNYPETDERAPSVHASSQRLVELFRAQAPVAPHLPPAIFGIDEPQDDVLARRYLPPGPAPRDAPPQPRFRRSLRLRGALTVPTSDYTEPYTAWWDSKTGASRIDFHESGTSTVRTMTPDGRVRRVEVRPDRVGERDVVRCGVTQSHAATTEDRAPVSLPDMEQFTFAGYSEGKGNVSRAEVWRRVVAGRGGEHGAARGEELTFRHEVMLRRKPGSDDPLPIKYAVSVDSSVLGRNADGYEHHYMEAHEEEPKPGFFDIDFDRVCDTREELDPSNADHLARLEPLREYTRPTRDPRHDAAFERFKAQFGRQYADSTEEAVRKSLVLQHTRFVESCNRMGAPFEVEVNYLCDRLEAELDLLLGVAFEEGSNDDNAAERFPSHELRGARSDLEREFDWRPRGAVTPVRNQGSCSSCWAFAVVGSVEGAHFIKTKKLVPLSEQTLVDCGHSHRTNACKGTWPKFAFNYVRDRGLPALEEYPAYSGKNNTCEAPPVPPVTRITAGVPVPPDNIDALKFSIRNFSPAVVVVDAKPKSFLTYKRGVLQDERCIKGPKKKLNHAVVSVGWGESRGAPHFILKNSWSAAWGDAGYIRVHAPTNTCGHLTTPEYTELRARDLAQQRPAQRRPALTHDYEDGY